MQALEMHSLSFDDRIFFTASIFLLVFFIDILNWQHFLLQATIFVLEPSPIKVFVETHVQSDDLQKKVVVVIAELNTLWYVGF